MKRPLRRRIFGAVIMFLAPFGIIATLMIAWIGLIITELTGE